MKMNKRDLQDLITVLNMTDNFTGKYPIGNKELTLKVRELESDGLIWYDALYKMWRIKSKSVDFRKE